MLVFCRVPLKGAALKQPHTKQSELAILAARDTMEDQSYINDIDVIAVLDTQTNTAESYVDTNSPYINWLPNFSSVENLNAYLRKEIPDQKTCIKHYKRNLRQAKKIMDSIPVPTTSCPRYDLHYAEQLLKYAQYWNFYYEQYKGPVDILDWSNTWQENECMDLEGNDTDVKNFKVMNAVYPDLKKDQKPPTHIVIAQVYYDNETSD